MTKENIDIFNEMVGHLFAQLYAAFPIPIEFDEIALVRSMGFEPRLKKIEGLDQDFLDGWPELPSGDSSFQYYTASVDWLIAERFIRRSNFGEHVLTAAALAALSRTPKAIGGATLGKRLGEVALAGGAEAGRAGVGGLVGEVIGGFAKSLAGG